jgi:ABC-2 type transport system permease protein
MSKIGIIIKREFLSRVTKKSFILTTLGLPLLMVGFSVLMGYLSASTAKKLNIAVVDESKVFENNLWDSSKTKAFTYFAAADLDSLKTQYETKEFDMLLHIKPFANAKPSKTDIEVISKASISSEANDYLENRINTVYQNKLMLDAGMNKKSIDSVNNITLSFENITADKSKANASLASGIGLFCGFIIYLVMFIYGMMVMRGVMEEKTNRIAEVIISSVKPFELMMGKVVGIALVGLTQFIIWIVFIGIIMGVIGSLFPGLMPTSVPVTPGMPAMQAAEAMQQMNKTEMSEAFKDLMGMPWLKIGICFIVYFLGGYFLYASLFAAVGSMVNEDAAESQSLTLPITMPIIVGFVISMQAAKDPNSGLAVFGSIFPLTSPLVMMSRIAYNPPMWQVLLSVALLIATFIGTIWLSAKIYRTGILMYGKKITWAEVGKWIFAK